MEAKILIVNTIVVEEIFYYLYDLTLLNKFIHLISMHCDHQFPISKVSSKNIIEKRRELIVRQKSIRNLIIYGINFLDFVRSKNILWIRILKVDA